MPLLNIVDFNLDCLEVLLEVDLHWHDVADLQLAQVHVEGMLP